MKFNIQEKQTKIYFISNYEFNWEIINQLDLIDKELNSKLIKASFNYMVWWYASDNTFELFSLLKEWLETIYWISNDLFIEDNIVEWLTIENYKNDLDRNSKIFDLHFILKITEE